jgi:hypothetical protein
MVTFEIYAAAKTLRAAVGDDKKKLDALKFVLHRCGPKGSGAQYTAEELIAMISPPEDQ